MDKDKAIYTITCFEKLVIDSLGRPSLDKAAFQGFYHEKDTAIEAVRLNAADIAESIYNYAVIEEIEPGLYSYPRVRWFFKYDRENDCYEDMDGTEFSDERHSFEEAYHEELIARAKAVFAEFRKTHPPKEITEEDLKDWDSYD